MTFEIVSLRNYMRRKSEESINELLSGFTCTKDLGIQRYLRETATKHEASHISRTYLIFDSDTTKRLVAFITIAIRCLNLDGEQHTSTLVERMNVNNGIAQSYLIGQFGKIDDYNKKVGEFAINFALDIIAESNKLVGCRVIRLDCINALIGYYEKRGFRLLNKNDEKNLNRMVMILD
ncbi:MAG: hypothetical protein FWF07_03640 [Methanomassiliicoccaceae archaeon]|nr:hypothetical protein [Methanomassiliicoccaceae archaeon]